MVIRIKIAIMLQKKNEGKDCLQEKTDKLSIIINFASDMSNQSYLI